MDRYMEVTRSHWYAASSQGLYKHKHCLVCLFMSNFPWYSLTHYSLRRDGQAELTWVANYIPGWFTNWAQR